MWSIEPAFTGSVHDGGFALSWFDGMWKSPVMAARPAFYGTLEHVGAGTRVSVTVGLARREWVAAALAAIVLAPGALVSDPSDVGVVLV
ncbi:MAG: hypothetical protein AAF211_17930, partial [Myxococcota bacterium]